MRKRKKGRMFRRGEAEIKGAKNAEGKDIVDGWRGIGGDRRRRTGRGNKGIGYNRRTMGYPK